MSGSNTQPLVADYSEWKARDYFDTYYSEVVLPDEQAVLAYQIEVLRAAGTRFQRGLEFGCGPTLHRTIAAARYATRLDLADWLPDNLDETRDWLHGDAGNVKWNRFTRYVLGCEGLEATPARVLEREALARKAVRTLHLSDAREKQPLGPVFNQYYDLLISGFCIDAISSDPTVFRECLRNITSMLRPGGLFIIHALHQCSAYKCGERMFPGSNLTADIMRETMLANGFTAGSIDAQVISCPDNAQYGYSGILTASAIKG